MIVWKVGFVSPISRDTALPICLDRDWTQSNGTVSLFGETGWLDGIDLQRLESGYSIHGFEAQTRTPGVGEDQVGNGDDSSTREDFDRSRVNEHTQVDAAFNRTDRHQPWSRVSAVHRMRPTVGSVEGKRCILQVENDVG